MDNIFAEDIRSLSLGDLFMKLENDLQYTFADPLGIEPEVFIKINPDPDIKFAYTAEARGVFKYHMHEVSFIILLKQGMAQSILLDGVTEFDSAQRSQVEAEAVKLALSALNSEEVHEARASVIKYQMLNDIIRILEA